MNRRHFFVLLVMLGLLSIARAEPLTEQDLKLFTPISEAIGRASNLTLFEGLPHQAHEADELKHELATKKTIRLHRFPFYEQPLAVGADAVEVLRHLSASAKSYQTYGGPKLCGGFHPDYCLAWQDGKTTYHLLICFGCHEMKLYGPGTELLVDLYDDAHRTFKSTLKPYRAQRPTTE